MDILPVCNFAGLRCTHILAFKFEVLQELTACKPTVAEFTRKWLALAMFTVALR